MNILKSNNCMRILNVIFLCSSLTAFGQTYTYDLDGRLTGATYANGDQANYTYDAAGSILEISSSTVQNGNSPVITIEGPSNTSAQAYTLLGTAVGANPIDFVLVNAGSAIWQTATTTNAFGNWIVSLTLVPGTNIVTIYVQDAEGNTASDQFSIDYVPPPLWTPTQLSSNLALWLDASNTGSITLNSVNVTQWKDLSGCGNSVSNVSASTQPLYIAGSATNLAAVCFNGSSSVLTASSHCLAIGTNPCTIYTVASIAPGAVGCRCLFSYGTKNNLSMRSHYESCGGQNAGVVSSDGDLWLNDNWTTQASILGSLFAKGYIYANFDGRPFSSMSAAFNTSANTPLNIGRNPDGGEYWFGNLYEIIGANAALTTNHTQQIEGYLAWKWGLQTSLPANHPYRYAAPIIVSNPIINASFAPGQGVQLQFSGAPSYPYILESATNLAPPIAWQPVATNEADTNGNWTITETNISTVPTRFYRVVAN
jgi:YD repeat-containing protein